MIPKWIYKLIVRERKRCMVNTGNSHEKGDPYIKDNGYCVRVGPEIPMNWEYLKKNLKRNRIINLLE